MIPTSIPWLVRLIIKISIAFAILYLVRLVVAKTTSSTVNGLYDAQKKHPAVINIVAIIIWVIIVTVSIVWFNLLIKLIS